MPGGLEVSDEGTDAASINVWPVRPQLQTPTARQSIPRDSISYRIRLEQDERWLKVFGNLSTVMCYGKMNAFKGCLAVA